MFSLRDFIKNGYLKAVGNRPDYWIILNAAGYLDKGILTEGDLEEIQEAIDAKNAAVIPPDVPDNQSADETPHDVPEEAQS